MPKSKGRRTEPAGRGRGPTPRRGTVSAQERALASPSDRYTKPIPIEQKQSPPWYGPMILGLLLVGVLVIVLNYVGLIPGDTSNLWLFVGLGFITAGFLAATNWK